MKILFAPLCWILMGVPAFHAPANRPPGRIPAPPAKKIQVRSNKNIELFGVVLSLDMGPDITANKDTVTIENRRSTWREWYATSYKLYLRYQKFDSGAVMQLYHKLVANGLYNDFFIGFSRKRAKAKRIRACSAGTEGGSTVPFRDSFAYKNGCPSVLKRSEKVTLNG